VLEIQMRLQNKGDAMEAPSGAKRRAQSKFSFKVRMKRSATPLPRVQNYRGTARRARRIHQAVQ
jgi:hypothetical protein